MKWFIWGCHLVFSDSNIELQMLALKNVLYSLKPTNTRVDIFKKQV